MASFFRDAPVLFLHLPDSFLIAQEAFHKSFLGTAGRLLLPEIQSIKIRLDPAGIHLAVLQIFHAGNQTVQVLEAFPDVLDILPVLLRHLCRQYTAMERQIHGGEIVRTGAVQCAEDYKGHQDERQEHGNDHRGDCWPGPLVRGCLHCQGNGCGCGHLHHLLSALYSISVFFQPIKTLFIR